MALASILEETHPLTMFLLLGASLLFFFFILRPQFSKTPNLPPGPRPWPVIGNLFDMGNKPHLSLARLGQLHGPLISLRLGSQLVVIGSSPAAAEQILKTHDRVLSGRHVPHVSYAKQPDNRSNVSVGWTDCGEHWKFLRTICRNHFFAPKIIDDQSHTRESKAQEMVQFLGLKEGEKVKIGEVVFVCVFKCLTEIFLSNDFIGFDRAGEEGISRVMRRIVELWTAPNISDMYPILGRLDLQGLRRKANEYLKELCKAWGDIIRERRENKGGELRKRKDFLDVMLENDFSDDQINYLLVELLIAGSDTSTSTIEWAMAELIRNQECMTNVLDELDQEISENHVRETHLVNLNYLHACVKETLRLHPPAPLNIPRRATESCKVMNYDIPRDTQVLLNVWAIGRDPNIWENSFSFRPERFLNSDLDFKGNHFEFLPFGGGRRICPGLLMGVRQIHLILASLLYHFKWSLPNGMLAHELDMEEKFGVTLQKEQPLVLIPRERKLYN